MVNISGLNNTDGFKKLPNWVIDKIMQSKNRIHMILAAWIFMFMYDRAELSLKNDWIDPKTNNVYIYFTYSEVKELLHCGTTTCWKIFSMLKKSGLISIKHQGFGQPNQIFLHTPDKKFEKVNKNAYRTTTDLLKKYAAATGNMFEEWQVAKIKDTAASKTANAFNEDSRISYVQQVFERFEEVNAKKTIENPFGYFMMMLQNGKARKKQSTPRGEPSENERSHSYDLAMFDDLCLKYTPKIFDG